MYENLLANVPTDLWIGGKWRKSSDDQRFDVTDPATERKVASVASATVDDAIAALDAAEKDGSRAKPEFGSIFWHLMGADQATARTHYTIATPGATAQSMGIPDNPKAGGVWIMNPGTSTAHLMIPGE